MSFSFNFQDEFLDLSSESIAGDGLQIAIFKKAINIGLKFNLSL